MQKTNLCKESNNIVQDSIDKLRTIFPDTVIDGKVDFDKLRNILGECSEIKDERYNFSWSGKTDALKLAYSEPTQVLKPCIEKSKNWDSTENIYIEGDNLEVLKLLQKSYKNKIRIIYIDPPYNTGNIFVYNDDFKDSIGTYKKTNGQISTGELSSYELEGRYHTNWLNMIYPRLILARNLLSEDGVIFISIDENEVDNLKKICHEIFGQENYITKFIYEKTQHFGRQKLNTYSNAEYILCYAKSLYNKGKLKELLVEKVKTELLDAPLYNASNKLSTLSFPKGTVNFNIKDGIYEKTTSNDYELVTPVEVVNGKNKNEFSLRFRSRWSADTALNSIKEGTRFLVKTKSFAIRAVYGKSKSTNVAPKQIIFTNSKNEHCAYSRFGDKVSTNENATNSLKQLLGEGVFSYPKPVSLITYLISLLYDEKEKDYPTDYTVLDFFSGSATTGEACICLNSKDNGKRKFILVQYPEVLDKNSKPYQAGYKNICEIGEERLRRAGEKIKTDIDQKNTKLEALTEIPDTGFRVFKLD